MRKYFGSYKDMLEEMEFIFSKKEAVIVGDHQLCANVIELLNKCKSGGLYRDIKISSYIIKEGEEPSFLDQLSQKNNGNKVLIICIEIERFDRSWICLLRSGFDRIINGKELINVGYKEICFNVSNCPKEVEKISRMKDFDLDINILEKLNQKDPYAGFILAAQEYQRRKNYLLAYDYFRLAYKLRNKDSDFYKMKAVEEKITFKTLSDYEIVNSLKKVISLNYYGRSGSIYCGALLEGHSKILTLPPGIIYSPYLRIYSLFYQKKGKIEIDEIIDVLCNDYSNEKQYEQFISLKTDNNIVTKQYVIDIKKYLRSLLLIEAGNKGGIISESFVYKALVYSHTKALGREINVTDGIPYVLDQQHENNGSILLKFIDFFEYNRVLVTVRDIIQNMGSLLAALERNQFFTATRTLNLFYYFSFNPILSSLAKKHHVFFLQIEKINLYSSETLKKLCGILCIDYEHVIERPTINGVKLYDSYAQSDYYYGPRREGVEKKYDKYFSKEDRVRLKKLFFPLLKAMDYNVENSDFEEVDWSKDFLFCRRLFFQNIHEQKKYYRYMQRICLEILNRSNEIEAYLLNTETI